jgi:dedicator of cytokinesis protein 1
MNETLRNLVISYYTNPEKPLGDLTMKLSGILDAAVMGGIANYEKAFLTPEYLEREPEDEELVTRLKQLIFLQSPILLDCLKIHERRAADALKPLQIRLEECYHEMVNHIETKYGFIYKVTEDPILTRELERIAKKRAIEERRQGQGSGSNTQPTQRHSSDSHRHQMTRGKGSTLSLYSGLPQKITKSMASIPRPQMMQRKSKQESVDEGIGGSSLTRVFFSGSSMSKLTSISGDLTETTENHAIPLTQTLSCQRPIRTEYNRNSLSWNVGEGQSSNRHSGLSICSAHSLNMSLNEDQGQGLGSQSQSASESTSEVEIEFATPPPLPPKQKDHSQNSDGKPPTPPPKKPTLRL